MPVDRQGESRESTTVPEERSERTITDLLIHLEAPGVDLSDCGIAGADDSKYLEGEEIARGAIGSVSHVRDLNIRRDVAMKRLLGAHRNDPAQTLRFIEEAQVTGQLEHPNIVPVHELGIDDRGQVFYTMKYVFGVTLADILNGIRKGNPGTVEAYPLGRLLNILLKACDAVAFAHSKGVVHRDLKPANIMVGEYGEVLVVDWGLARVIELPDRGAQKRSRKPATGKTKTSMESGKRTRRRPNTVTSSSDSRIETSRQTGSHPQYQTLVGAVMGTPVFMAPEQAHGASEKIDERTDIYALGGVLYNILTLNTPVQGETVSKILIDVAENKIRHPESYNQELDQVRGLSGQDLINRRDLTFLPHCPGERIPPALGAVAMKALSKSRQARYQTVKELQQEIEAFQSGFATSAEDAGVFTLLRLLLKRHRREVFVAALAVGLVAVVVTMAFVQGNRERQSALKAQRLAEQSEQRAVAALRQFEEARRQRLALGKDYAPTLLVKAHELIALSKSDISAWQRAHKQVDEALGLHPNYGPALVLKGRLLLGDLKLHDALDTFRRALKVDRERVGREAMRYAGTISSYARRMQKNGELSEDELATLAEKLDVNSDHHLAAFLFGKAGDIHGRYLALLKAARQEYQSLYPDSGIVHLDFELDEQAGRYIVRLKKVNEFGPMRGVPVEELHISNVKTPDLSGLERLPIDTLLISSSEIDDISLLPQLPLRRFEYHAGGSRQSKLVDLSILSKTKITALKIAGTATRDFSFLRELRLINVELHDVRFDSTVHLAQSRLDLAKFTQCAYLKDLDGLKGMPIVVLSLEDTRVSDLSPLAEARIQHLDLVNSPITDISILSRMPLREARIENMGVKDISALRQKPMIKLSLANTPITHLKPLAGLPLRELDLSFTRVKDIRVLANMPLRILDLSHSPVKDLRPLASCPQLRQLTLAGTAVRSIKPLSGLGLQRLRLDQCRSLRSISPLKDIRSLTHLTIPQHCEQAAGFLVNRVTILKLATRFNEEFPWTVPRTTYKAEWDEKYPDGGSN